MTSNSRLIHQWVFPDIHVKTRFVKAHECTQVLLIICKGNWQQREHPKWLCSSETSEMHLASFLIFSQCDNGGVCVCVCVHACVCISRSLRFYLPTPLWCQGVPQLKKKNQVYLLQVACFFTFLPNMASLFCISPLPSHVNSLIIKEHQNWSRENVVEKQRIQGAWRAEMTSAHLTGVFDCI